MKIFTVTHGELALGLKDSLQMMCANLENIEFCSLKNDGTLVLEEEILAKCAGESDVLFLCDIIGGSPANTCFKIVHEQNLNGQVICGVNLAMLLTVYLSRNNHSILELANVAIESGVESIKNITVMKVNEEDE